MSVSKGTVYFAGRTEAESNNWRLSKEIEGNKSFQQGLIPQIQTMIQIGQVFDVLTDSIADVIASGRLLSSGTFFGLHFH